VDVHVRWLREKLEVDPADPVRLVTVRGAAIGLRGNDMFISLRWRIVIPYIVIILMTTAD
jgi:hypothetical protein